MPRRPRMRRVMHSAIAVLTTLGTAGLIAVAASGASASAAPTITQAAKTVNPESPAYAHPYRHGVTPTRATAQKMANWAQAHPNVPAASANNLTYGGAIDGIGVTTGPEKVYLVFYGSQWGTQGTNSSGYTTLSGDPSGEAPDLQGFFKGLGTGNELWSGVLTQYCDGVATGAQTCPASNTEH